MNEWSNFEKSLEQLATGGSVEVREDGEWLAGLETFRWEIRLQGKKALLHLWSSESNLVRSILRVADNKPDRILLDVQRFGKAKPGHLEFLRCDGARPAARISREQFRARFARMLAEQFPDARIAPLTTAADLKHSFSALYTRGTMTEGRSCWAVMGVSPSESVVACEGILSFGLLWLDWTRQRAGRRAVEGLRLFLPAGQSRTTLERARALRPSAGLEVFEFDERDWRFRRAEISGKGNIESKLVPRLEIEKCLAAAAEAVESVRALLPNEPDLIEVTVPPGTRDVALRFRGLEFARWRDGGMEYGLGKEKRPLSSASAWSNLRKLLLQLSLKRSPLSSRPNDSLFRVAPERWLESMVISDPTRIAAELDSRFVYSQVPALAAGDRGVIDLLSVTRQGRLVVIELKASEDLHLPLQAVDYLLRVRRHLLEGDFSRYGYFSGVDLSPDPPLVYLVAPSLRFHPANEIILRYISTELRIFRIGVSEHWRKGLHVVLRQ